MSPEVLYNWKTWQEEDGSQRRRQRRQDGHCEEIQQVSLVAKLYF